MRRPRAAGGWREAGLLAAAALGACTPAPTPSRPGPTSEDVVRATGTYQMEMTLRRSDVQIFDTLRVDAARAWDQLPAVYQALGLPVNASDARLRRIAVTGYQARRIEGQPLSRFLDCGRGLTAGDYADNYQVYLSMETRLVTTSAGPEPSRSTVASTLSANARPRAVSGNPVPCQSLGRLERRVTELLQQRLSVSSGG